MTLDQLTAYASFHAYDAKMRSSAEFCLIQSQKAICQETSKYWVLRSLEYSVGIFDSVYIANKPKKTITMETTKYARCCDECGAGMNEGYCIDSGSEYYCSEECLHKHYTAGEWNDMYRDGDGDSYFTSWDDEDDYQYEMINGELIEIE